MIPLSARFTFELNSPSDDKLEREEAMAITIDEEC